MDEIEFISGSVELLDEIEQLWNSQKKFHCDVCTHFAENFGKRHFQQRKKELCEKSETGKLRIEIARIKGEPEPVGYCVSSVDKDGNGEIDSIFVKSSYRRLGIASRLVDASLKWMDSLGAKKKTISVLFGNDTAIDFYKKFNFYPRTFELEQKEAGC